MYLNKSKSEFTCLEKCEAFLGKLYPCSLEEVDELEKKIELKLPASYVEFLLWTGNGGGFFAGHEFDVKRVGTVNVGSARELLNEYNKLSELPNDAIIIIFYQGGYMFDFIQPSEGDDPPVHRVSESEDGLEFIWRFSNNLEEHCLKKINHLISAYQ
jgi:hypothetical protein